VRCKLIGSVGGLAQFSLASYSVSSWRDKWCLSGLLSGYSLLYDRRRVSGEWSYVVVNYDSLINKVPSVRC